MSRQNLLKRHEDRCCAVTHVENLMQTLNAQKDEEMRTILAQKDEEMRTLLAQKEQEMQDRLKQKDQEVQALLKQKDEEIVKLELHVAKHEKTIADIARQPRTTTSNSKFVVNLPQLTTEHLQSNAQYLSLDHVKKGFQGYAEYALEYPLKGMVTCTDFSRRKVKYNNEEGETVVDPDMKKLCTDLFAAIRGRNQDLTNEYMKEMKDKADSGEWNRNDIQDLVFEIITQNGDFGAIASGDCPDVLADFVKRVCSGLTSS